MISLVTIFSLTFLPLCLFSVDDVVTDDAVGTEENENATQRSTQNPKLLEIPAIKKVAYLLHNLSSLYRQASRILQDPRAEFEVSGPFVNFCMDVDRYIKQHPFWVEHVQEDQPDKERETILHEISKKNSFNNHDLSILLRIAHQSMQDLLKEIKDQYPTTDWGLEETMSNALDRHHNPFV